MRYVVDESTSLCFVLVFTMGSDQGTPEASPKRRRFHAVFRFFPRDALITGQETAH